MTASLTSARSPYFFVVFSRSTFKEASMEDLMSLLDEEFVENAMSLVDENEKAILDPKRCANVEDEFAVK